MRCARQLQHQGRKTLPLPELPGLLFKLLSRPFRAPSRALRFLSSGQTTTDHTDTTDRIPSSVRSVKSGVVGRGGFNSASDVAAAAAAENSRLASLLAPGGEPPRGAGGASRVEARFGDALCASASAPREENSPAPRASRPFVQAAPHDLFAPLRALRGSNSQSRLPRITPIPRIGFLHPCDR